MFLSIRLTSFPTGFLRNISNPNLNEETVEFKDRAHNKQAENLS